MEKKIYKKEKHTEYYSKDNVKVPNVTSIIKILDKPALVGWAYNLGLAGEKSPYEVLNEAGAIGTIVHKIIHHRLTGKDEGELRQALENSYEDDLMVASIAVERWNEFQNSYEVTPLFTEKKLVSEKYQYGGTLDIWGSLNGVPTIIDIKTSSGIYLENYLQLAAYAILVEENEKDSVVEQCAIVRVGKKIDDKLEVKYISREQIGLLKVIFLTTLDLHNKINGYKYYEKKIKKEKKMTHNNNNII